MGRRQQKLPAEIASRGFGTHTERAYCSICLWDRGIGAFREVRGFREIMEVRAIGEVRGI